MARRLALGALIVSEVLSLSGTRLSMIAVPWLVLTLSGDAILTGIVAMAEMAPYVVAKALGGPLIDRFGPRRVSMLGDFGSMLVIAMVPLLDALGALEPLAFVPLMAVLGTLRGPADAAKHALVPAISRDSGVPLEQLTGIMGTIERLASTIGAGLAGALVAAVGAAPALLVNAVTFGLAALVIRLLLPPLAPATETKDMPKEGGYWGQLGEGYAHLRDDTVLVGIAVMIALTNFWDQAFATVFVPVWAAQTGQGAAVLGLVFAVFSGFSALGALVATVLAARLPRLPIYIGAFLIIGLPRFAIFAVDAPLAGILAVMAIGGFASGFLNPILSAVILERIPEPLVGRVSSLVSAAAWALMPFGGVAAGALIAGLGLATALWLAGGVYLAITLAPLFLKRFRAFSRRPATAIPAP